jgi:signal transduction histidine kinase/integral membrane sensor domain MASE1
LPEAAGPLAQRPSAATSTAVTVWLNAAFGPVVLAVAYYFGSQLGFVLRFPPATTSILWPPNAILTAALLLSPPRRWWRFLLAVLPAHLAVQVQVGLPLSLIVALYSTNCFEAVVGAGLAHRLSDAPGRFDTLRRAALLILAVVLLAPILSGFVDAAAVAVLHGEPYWHVWQTRLFSNTLTALALVPVLVSLIRSPSVLRKGVPPRRAVEALLLVLSLIAAGGLIFAPPFLERGPFPAWWEQSELVLLLPLLLWAAARFGAAGSSFALLTTAALAFLAATSSSGSATVSQAAHAVRGLQAFLLVSGIPLFGLGALMEERRSTEQALGERLEFEALLSRISAAFVHLPSNAMDAAFEAQLRQAGNYSGLAGVLLFRVSTDAQRLELVAHWSASGDTRGGPPPGWSPPELLEHAARHEDWRIEDDGGWTLGIPLQAGNTLLGTLVFVGRSAEVRGHEEPATRLHLIAEVFASALARKQSEDALRAGEEMKSSILASLSGQVAVLDRSGRIIAANQTWPAAARVPGPDAPGAGGATLSYAEACRRAAGSGLPDTPEAGAGVQAVLAGTRASFTLEYPCRTEAGDRWFMLSVVPLRRPEGGAVAAHVDVTERRRAEDEARRSREELAHFLRVSTVGELTTSLAHELNQPLTAILANAQAARMLLQEGADPREMREILDDIVEEDKRAGEVIRRLRELLRKGEPEHAPLDLNLLATDMVRLVGSDATIRNVSIRVELAPQPSMVSGDRIQIQQVVLNLLLNAMDAMADYPPERRTVLVSTVIIAPDVHLSVRDTGTGLRQGRPERVFEPFYTTKPAGMGMGLSIARSIVEAHGGRIWAGDNVGPGATFTFSLPLGPSGSTSPGS